jgi:hypothetical protein
MKKLFDAEELHCRGRTGDVLSCFRSFERALRKNFEEAIDESEGKRYLMNGTYNKGYKTDASSCRVLFKSHWCVRFITSVESG